MATSNYSQGARRSSVPRLLQPAVSGQQALLSDDELMKLIFGQQAAQQAAQSKPQTGASGMGVASTGSSFAPALSEAIGTGTSVRSGNLADAAKAVQLGGNVSAGLSLLGILTGDSGAMKAGSTLGQAAGIGGAGVGLAAAQTPGQAATAIAPLAGSLLGVPGALTNFGVSALNDNKAGMLNAGFSLIPGVGMANTALQLLTAAGDGKVSLGDIAVNQAEGSKIFGDVGPVDATQGLMTLSRGIDPIGGLLGVLGENITDNPGAVELAKKAIDVTDAGVDTGLFGGPSNTSGLGYTNTPYNPSADTDTGDTFTGNQYGFGFAP